MDEIMKTIEECPIENLIFCYLKDGRVKTYMKGDGSDNCLNMALMIVRQIVRDQVKEDGENPEELRVDLYYAVNKIIDDVKALEDDDNGN